MPSLSDVYNAAVQKARRKYFEVDSRRFRAEMYRAYGEMLARIAADVAAGELDHVRAAVLSHRIREYIERFAGQFAGQLDRNTAKTVSDLVERHSEATIDVARLAGRGEREAFEMMRAFYDVPDEVVRASMIRRKISGGSGAFETLVRRRLDRVAPAIDDYLTFASATGVSSERATRHLMYAMGADDPVIGAAVRRAFGDRGRLLLRDVKREMKDIPGDAEEKVRALRRLRYDARRIAVTEYHTTYFEADRMMAEASDVVAYLRWELSGRHFGLKSVPCECDYYATADVHGYGPGIWHPSAVPAKPHPHCACITSKVLREPKDWDKPKPDVPYFSYNAINPESVGKVIETASQRLPNARKMSKGAIETMTESVRSRIESAHRYGLARRKALEAHRAARQPLAATASAFPAVLDEVEPVRRLGGSTGAELVRSKAGRFYVQKRGASVEHLREEAIADAAYRAAGVDVPDFRLYANDSVKLSEFIAGRTMREILDAGDTAAFEAAREKMQKHFVMDALMGNRDVVGLDFDNVLVDGAGRVWRIDNGASLRFRAQGATKAYGAAVEELDTLLDKTINAQTARIFEGITRAEMRRQAKEVQDNLPKILATLPDELKPVFEARLKDALARLEDFMGDEFAAAAKVARLNGQPIDIDKLDIEDVAALVWEEKSVSGTPVTRINLRMTAAGDAKVVSRLGTTTSAPFDVDDAWNTILSGAKTVNHHAADGLYNTATMDRVFALKATLDALDETEWTGVEPYYHALHEIITAYSSRRTTRVFVRSDFGPVLSTRKAAATAIRARDEQVFFPLKVHDRGFATQTTDQAFADRTGQNWVTSWKVVDLGDGVTVRYKPYGSTPDRNYYALQGQMQIEVNGPLTGETLAKARAALERLGIDAVQATPEFRESLYVFQNINLRRDVFTAKMRAEASATLADGSISDAERLRRLKKMLTDHLDVKHYNPKPVRNSFGEGQRYFWRADYSPEAMAHEMRDYVLVHNSSADPGDLLEQLLQQGGNLTGVHERGRRGVPMWYGMSPQVDMNNGPGAYVFTRIKRRADYHRTIGSLVFKPGLLARLDAMSFQADWLDRNHAIWKDAVRTKATGKTVADFKKMALGSSNETIFKDGINILDWIDAIIVDTAAERDRILQIFRAHGYTRLPDGRDIEDVVRMKL